MSSVSFYSIQELKERIRQRTNLSLGPVIDTHGETFLSPELVVNLLQETRHAFERCHKVRPRRGSLGQKNGTNKVCGFRRFNMFLPFLSGLTQLSDPSDQPKNAFSIFLLLVEHLCVDHIDYALEIGLSGTGSSAVCKRRHVLFHFFHDMFHGS